MESLVSDVLELIFRKLDVKSLVQSMSVCHHWKKYAMNWRVWRALYFERWPHFKDDNAYLNAVGDQWKSLYIRLHTYSNDLLYVNTVPIPPTARRLIEEVLVSHVSTSNGGSVVRQNFDSLLDVQNKNCLFCASESAYFLMVYELFEENARKNELFNTFFYDRGFAKQAESFHEEFLTVLTAAKAQGKKTLLMVNDYTAPNLISLLVRNQGVANEFIQVLNDYRDDIIVMMFTRHPNQITEPFIKVMAAHKFNLVHIGLPDENCCKEILRDFESRDSIELGGKVNTLQYNLDHEVLVKYMLGADANIIRQFLDKALTRAITRARNERPAEDAPIHIVVTTEDVVNALSYGRIHDDINQPFHCVSNDADILRTLKSMADSYPDDLRLMSLVNNFTKVLI